MIDAFAELAWGVPGLGHWKALIPEQMSRQVVQPHTLSWILGLWALAKHGGLGPAPDGPGLPAMRWGQKNGPEAVSLGRARFNSCRCLQV